LDSLVTAELIDVPEFEGAEARRYRAQSLVFAVPAFTVTSLILVRSALSKGQDWSFDSHSYHNVYAYASVFERSRLGHPMSLGAYFNPLLDLPLGWGVRNFNPKTVTTGIVMVQSIAIAGAATLPWHCITGRVLPQPTGWRPGRTDLLWGATYGLSVVVAYGAFSGIELGATWGDLTSVVPVVVALHLLVRWARARNNNMLLLAGAFFGVACGLKYTNGSSLIGGVMFVTVAVLYRSDASKRLTESVGALCRFLAGCIVGVVASLGPWALVEMCRFGNPVFPFGGRRFNDELITTTGGYVDLGSSTFSIRTAEEFFGDPIRLLRRTTAISEFAVRDPRLFVSAFCCIVLVAVGVRASRPGTAVAQQSAEMRPAATLGLGIAFAGYWLATYSSWAFLFGNGRYLVMLELLTPTLLCVTVVGLASARRSERSSAGHRIVASMSALACVAVATVPLTVSPDYGHVPFGRRWYDFDTAKLPPLTNAMVIVPYEYEPLDFAEFVLAPRAYARLHGVLLPTWLGQREVQRIRAFDGPLYSFQLTAAGDVNLEAVGVHRTGECYSVPSSTGTSYSLCRLERNP
jgi:hypothetical protein